ncbi:MAG TPA: CpsD/CapB family tyrosine-protein kinase [Terriglobia bacterium]|nr:CpsD/CapB family tyrosine-protein kinase [Terriglobia bacterium]
MDRLEKALMKAREQRRDALDQIRAINGRDTISRVAGELNGNKVTRLEPAAPMIEAVGEAPAQAPAQTRRVDLVEPELVRNRIVARRQKEPAADTFRILRTKVMQLMARNNLRSIAVTSPRYGDGKSTIAINLALSLALDVKQTVCLVDLDFRQPSVHRYLGIEPQLGLCDYLLHDTPIAQCLVRPSHERMVVLPTKSRLENSSETLGTPKMAALAQELKSRYPDRIIIYDMPPLLAQDDAIGFLPHVDGVLLVVREGATKIEEVRQAMHLLSNTTVVGTVLNNAAERGYNRMNNTAERGKKRA